MAGTLVVSNLNDGTNTGNTTDMIKGSARAWVNFNGSGTVAIRASYNVSSITDNGVGDYTINFTTAMPNTNYSVSFGASVYSSIARNISYGFNNDDTYPATLNSFRTLNRASDGTNIDMSNANASIFI